MDTKTQQGLSVEEGPSSSQNFEDHSRGTSRKPWKVSLFHCFAALLALLAAVSVVALVRSRWDRHAKMCRTVVLRWASPPALATAAVYVGAKANGWRETPLPLSNAGEHSAVVKISGPDAMYFVRCSPGIGSGPFYESLAAPLGSSPRIEVAFEPSWELAPVTFEWQRPQQDSSPTALFAQWRDSGGFGLEDQRATPLFAASRICPSHVWCPLKTGGSSPRKEEFGEGHGQVMQLDLHLSRHYAVDVRLGDSASPSQLPVATKASAVSDWLSLKLPGLGSGARVGVGPARGGNFSMTSTSFLLPKRFVLRWEEKEEERRQRLAGERRVVLFLGWGRDEWRQQEMLSCGPAEYSVTVHVAQRQTRFFVRGFGPSSFVFESDIRSTKTHREYYLAYEAGWATVTMVLQTPFANAGQYYVQWRDSGGLGKYDHRGASVDSDVPGVVEQNTWHAVQSPRSQSDSGSIPELCLSMSRLHCPEFRVGFSDKPPKDAFAGSVQVTTGWQQVPMQEDANEVVPVWAKLEGPAKLTVVESAERAHFHVFKLINAKLVTSVSVFLGLARDVWERELMNLDYPSLITLHLAFRSSRQLKKFFFRCSLPGGVVAESPFYDFVGDRVLHTKFYKSEWEPVRLKLSFQEGTHVADFRSVSVLWEDGRGPDWGSRKARYDDDAVAMINCLQSKWCRLHSGKLTLLLSRFHPARMRVAQSSRDQAMNVPARDWIKLEVGWDTELELFYFNGKWCAEETNG